MEIYDYKFIKKEQGNCKYCFQHKELTAKFFIDVENSEETDEEIKVCNECYHSICSESDCIEH